MPELSTINTFSMITFNISLSKELADIVETEIKDKKFANRSEFFRDLIRREYVLKSFHDIEIVDPDDPDYKLVEERSKDSRFLNISDIK